MLIYLIIAWAPVVGVDSYNVYVDGVYATNVNGTQLILKNQYLQRVPGNTQ